MRTDQNATFVLVSVLNSWLCRIPSVVQFKIRSIIILLPTLIHSAWQWFRWPITEQQSCYSSRHQQWRYWVIECGETLESKCHVHYWVSSGRCISNRTWRIMLPTNTSKTAECYMLHSHSRYTRLMSAACTQCVMFRDHANMTQLKKPVIGFSTQ